MTNRLALALIAALVAVALGVSWQLLERSLSGGVVQLVGKAESRWTTCEFSHSRAYLKELAEMYDEGWTTPMKSVQRMVQHEELIPCDAEIRPGR